MQPEIYNDELFFKIVDLVGDRRPAHILEIGSGAGRGSTQAFIKGSQYSMNPVRLYCIEAHKDRYAKLKELENTHRTLFAYNVSSVSVGDYMTDVEVEDFYNTHEDMQNIRKFPLEEIKRWRNDEISYIVKNDTKQNGIEIIMAEHKLSKFDMVLIDGSPFTGGAELRAVYGAGIIILDDTVDIKNCGACEQLRADPAYGLIAENPELRNGYAVFGRAQ